MSGEAGAMDRKFMFDEPRSRADGSGGFEEGWREQFTAWGAVMHMRGGETVQAARLEGRQPVVITIHASADARRVTADWRVRDVHRLVVDEDGAPVAGVYAVTAPPVLTDDRQYLEITCEAGRAA